MLSRKSSMLHKEGCDSTSTAALTSGSVETGETMSNRKKRTVSFVCPLPQSAHVTKGPAQPPPDQSEKRCGVLISGHRYEVLVRKHITFENGVYYFDGSPLKDQDPRIISIDNVIQASCKVQAQRQAVVGEAKVNASISSVPGTLFSSSNPQVKEANCKVSEFDIAHCCCIQ